MGSALGGTVSCSPLLGHLLRSITCPLPVPRLKSCPILVVHGTTRTGRASSWGLNSHLPPLEMLYCINGFIVMYGWPASKMGMLCNRTVSWHPPRAKHGPVQLSLNRQHHQHPGLVGQLDKTLAELGFEKRKRKPATDQRQVNTRNRREKRGR